MSALRSEADLALSDELRLLLTDGVDKVGDLREGSVYSFWRLELARFLAASETSGDTDLSDQRSGLSLTQTIRPVCAAAGARNSWRVS